MPLAVVLTRASRCFYLRLSRFSARKGIPGSGLCPLTMLRHHVNLQARYALRQGIPLLLGEPSVALSSLRYPCCSSWKPTLDQSNACAFSGHLLTVRMLPGLARMAAPMVRPLMIKLPFVLGCSLVAAVVPHALRAQLVRQNTAPTPQQTTAKQDPQNPASAQTPQGK